MSKEKKKSDIPPDKLAFYEKLIQTIPGLELKGATMPYTSLNGNMFTFLDKKGTLGIRLPPGDKENFIRKYKTTLCEAYGTVLKEYASVPEKLMQNTKELKKYFGISYEYVKTLKPKPQTKKFKV